MKTNTKKSKITKEEKAVIRKFLEHKKRENRLNLEQAKIDLADMIDGAQDRVSEGLGFEEFILKLLKGLRHY